MGVDMELRLTEQVPCNLTFILNRLL